MTTRVTKTAIWLRIFCAVLLLSLGFGHKPLYARPAPALSDAAFVLPDGTFGLLCLGDAGEGKPQKSGWHGCDACLVAFGALLPPPPADYAPADGNFRSIDLPFTTACLVRQTAWPGSPVRGPPPIFA